MPNYSEDADWADIQPIDQDEGGLHPLAAIAYTDEYSEAMSYLRAVMAKNEMSERALSLTEHIITLNPAHYTVWLYRAKILFALNSDLRAEIEWLNPTALKHLKNYQIWHHRQIIVDKLDTPEGEVDFIMAMFEPDAKNYHVWSYRQWLVRRFDLWDKGEMESIEQMLRDDVRNNSAWNHRWFLVFGNEKRRAAGDEAVVKREVDYAKRAIRLAPQNQSPWNYLRGVLRQAKLPTSTIRDFALEFASLDRVENIYSSHALDALADVYAEEEGKKEQAVRALDLLANKFDPIRASYWQYRKSVLEARA